MSNRRFDDATQPTTLRQAADFIALFSMIVVCVCACGFITVPAMRTSIAAWCTFMVAMLIAGLALRARVRPKGFSGFMIALMGASVLGLFMVGIIANGLTRLLRNNGHGLGDSPQDMVALIALLVVLGLVLLAISVRLFSSALGHQVPAWTKIYENDMWTTAVIGMFRVGSRIKCWLVDRLYARHDPSGDWQRDTEIPVVIELGDSSLMGVRPGDQIDKLHPLGRVEIVRDTVNGKLSYPSRGLWIDFSETNRIDSYWIVFTSMSKGEAPFDGEIRHNGQSLVISHATNPDDLIADLGPPTRREDEPDGVLLYYHRPDNVRWEIDFEDGCLIDWLFVKD
ncbi:hypothetical protein HED60_17665 [Planctomycetales bacterium ZRK34]|nr:hypothetical protein HED60_17665 [Planctomycetales bacterium ZRK34]